MQIIVLGPSLSGTSVVTRLLNLMGVYVGPEGSSLPADSDHPKGVWERRDVVELNRKLLAAWQSEGKVPSSFHAESIAKDHRARFTRRAAEIVHGLDAHRPWVLKDPRFCLLLPLWRPLLELPIAVLVHRCPCAVSRSLESRFGLVPVLGAAIWELYVGSALAGSTDLPRILVSFDELMEQPVAAVADLHRRLAELDVRGLRRPNRREVLGYVDRDLHHHPRDRDECAKLLNPTQQALLRALDDGTAFELAEPPVLSPAAAEILELHGEMEAGRAELGGLSEENRSASAELKVVSSELEKLSDETDAMREKSIAAFESRVAELKEDNAKLKEDNAKLKEDNAKLKEAAARELARLESQVTSVEEERRAAERKIAMLSSQGKLFEDQLRAAKSKYQKLKKGYDHRKVKQQELRDVLTAIETSRSWRVAQAVSTLFAVLTFRWGRLRRTTGARPAKTPATKAVSENQAEIVVCVHNALDDVRRCLESVVAHTEPRHRLILVNDGSDEATSGYLQDFTRRHGQVELLESAAATGYTRAANRGVKAATAGGFVVLLNSDTVVSEGWLEGLAECFRSSERIGIVGALSNAATYQSVPERYDGKGDWAINTLPPGWDVERMARLVASVSKRRYPRVPFVNGFCFAIRRSVIEAIGGFDEERFPRGYGEENDYCLRAAAAGFELAIADQVYVYHGKSKSYSHEVRRELSKAGSTALQERHDRETIQRKTEELRNQPELARIRDELARLLPRTTAVASPLPDIRREGYERLRVLFLLPVAGGDGGVHAVIEDAVGMRRLGCDARIAVNKRHHATFLDRYPAVDPELFFAYTHDDLVDFAADCHVVIATIFTSVRRLAEIYEAHPHIVPAYYIQDYEPWFVLKGSDLERQALESYTLIPDMVHFAKTQWLCETLHRLQGIQVHKVVPGLDTALYYPSAAIPAASRDREPIRVVAMIRPRTPRRGAKSTMEVLKDVRQELGAEVRVSIFGCQPDDQDFLELERDFEFEHLGLLRREEVGDLLRESDVFVDFSLYQAFGRTALEAMACGCAAIVPEEGGTDEYAVHEQNALVVDTYSHQKMKDALLRLATDDHLRRSLIQKGLETAMTYSLAAAAASELALLRGAFLERQRQPTAVTSVRSG